MDGIFIMLVFQVLTYIPRSRINIVALFQGELQITMTTPDKNLQQDSRSIGSVHFAEHISQSSSTLLS